MIVYATHRGGRYLPFAKSLQEVPEGKRGLYVNLTNRCNCDCVFCLRQKKEMAAEASLWLEREPTLAEVVAALEAADWEFVSEAVFCGFGEPTLRLEELLGALRHIKKSRPNISTRLNTNGLGELAHGREIASDFAGLLDVASISLNASTAERYLSLTRAEYGIDAFEAMLTFAEHCRAYIPKVVMTIVDKVNSEDEINRCRALCAARGLTLRVRPYEAD